MIGQELLRALLTLGIGGGDRAVVELQRMTVDSAELLVDEADGGLRRDGRFR
jgi:hypothetical protein